MKRQLLQFIVHAMRRLEKEHGADEAWSNGEQNEKFNYFSRKSNIADVDGEKERSNSQATDD